MDGFIYPYPVEIPKFKPKLDLAILASGKGSNFERIMEDINNNILDATIKCLIVNNPECGAIDVAKKYLVPYNIINHKDYNCREELDNAILNTLNNYDVEGIVMVGWMRIVTSILLSKYQGRVVNLHPSLLPSFKGNKAIQQTLLSKVKITGCTVHLVDEKVDSGEIIIQAAFPVKQNHDEITLLNSVQKYEHKIISLGIALSALNWRKKYLMDKNY